MTTTAHHMKATINISNSNKPEVIIPRLQINLTTCQIENYRGFAAANYIVGHMRDAGLLPASISGWGRMEFATAEEAVKACDEINETISRKHAELKEELNRRQRECARAILLSRASEILQENEDNKQGLRNLQEQNRALRNQVSMLLRIIKARNA